MRNFDLAFVFYAAEFRVYTSGILKLEIDFNIMASALLLNSVKE